MQLQFSDMEISRLVHISDNEVTRDGRIMVTGGDILRAGYRDLELEYPKFYKMDVLAQAGIIGTEYLLRDIDMSRYGDDRLAIVMNSREGSMASDIRHHQALQAGMVSPAVFVYTLPNIVLGEIAIRHKMYGEQICTLSNGPDCELLTNICKATIDTGKADAVVLMHLDAMDDYLNCTLILIEKGKDAGPENELSVETLKKILTDG